MSTTDNKALVRRLADAFNRGDADTAASCFAEDYIHHSPMPGMAPGREGVRLLLGAMRQSFPDFKILLERVIAEDDLVAAYITVSGTHEGEFFAMPPTGRRFSAPYAEFMRIRDGEIVEIWVVRDQLAMMQQLGMTPGGGA